MAAPDRDVAWYDKQRLVPGWEARDVPGDTPLIVDAVSTRLGIAICKDMHIPSIGRDDWMGARMTALRAVENGYAVARDGLLGAYDRTGRVLASLLLPAALLRRRD